MCVIMMHLQMLQFMMWHSRQELQMCVLQCCTQICCTQIIQIRVISLYSRLVVWIILSSRLVLSISSWSISISVIWCSPQSPFSLSLSSSMVSCLANIIWHVDSICEWLSCLYVMVLEWLPLESCASAYASCITLDLLHFFKAVQKISQLAPCLKHW